jgi:hypothetical protein
MNVVRNFKLAWFGAVVLIASLLFYPIGRIIGYDQGLGVAFLFVIVLFYVVPIFAFVGLLLMIVGIVRGRIIENAKKVNSPDA